MEASVLRQQHQEERQPAPVMLDLSNLCPEEGLAPSDAATGLALTPRDPCCLEYDASNCTAVARDEALYLAHFVHER
jgi:hypothetical protein